MNTFVFATFFVIALFFKSYDCAEDVEPQIKAKRVELHMANPGYINGLALEYNITKANATYNNIGVHWEVKFDLPANIKLLTFVLATDENGENPELLKADETYVCVESAYRQFLPKLLVVDSSELGTDCIKKGIYDVEDMGQFRFEHLVKDLPNKGKYYQVMYMLSSLGTMIMRLSVFSEWGYLNN